MSNPLLDLSGLPRFGAIRAEHVTPALDHVLDANRRELERLMTRGDFSWEGFAQPLEDMRERLARVWSPVSHLHAVMDSEPLRAAYNECLPKLSEYYTELAQDERVYRVYKTLAASAEYATLTPAQRKIIDNTLRDFRLAGAELPPEKKARFKQIQTELATLTSKFSENVLDATQAWELHLTDEADLAGLPESARAMARQAAEQKGKAGWLFNLEFPSYFALMTYGDNRALRRQMYEAYVTRASDQGPHAGRWDNGELMLRILRLRQESARLLDFADYAQYALQTRMAKTVAEVMEFLHELAARAKPAAERDYQELKRFTRAQAGFDPEAWDLLYYSEKLQQANYRISQEDLRPYFPETKAVPGLFAVVERLYGLKIAPLAGVEVWHPDVRAYEIRDEAGAVRGRFYMDLYARANKRGGAWMDECTSRKRTRDGVQVPVAYLVCNFTPPVGGKPALFTHDEVLTLFHEFGHGLHHMLTRVDYVGVAGINGVAWDAVELPSQFMENWCWERAALDLLAAHHETGAPLPDELYRKMIAARNFQSGMQFVRQLEFALFDMRLHTDFDPMKSRASALGSPPSPSGRGNEGEGPRDESKEMRKAVQELLDEVRREVAVVFPPPYNRFQNGFTHIFSGGYAAGYYSYKWAEVLSADAYSKFEERGVFDRDTGREFLAHILEQGGVREPMELFVNFRGRKPKIDALLRHSGLAA
jgi:oligopeptidase A